MKEELTKSEMSKVEKEIESEGKRERENSKVDISRNQIVTATVDEGPPQRDRKCQESGTMLYMYK